MQITDFLVQSYTSHSKPLNAARCVNLFAETELQDAKSKSPVGVWGVPGISGFVDTNDGPIQALHVMNNVVYAVGGTHLWQINGADSVADLGAHGARGSTISIDDNGVQMVWVDGLTGWYFQAGGTPTQISDVNFYPSNTVTYFDGYFVFVHNGTKEFYLSPLFGVVPFDGTQFASKEATSDLLLAIANSHEQLYLFGQERTEVWYDAGNAPPTFPFQRSDGAIIQRGLIAPLSIVLEDNTLFFLADDLCFYRVQGFVPQRLSNHAVENTWQGYSKVSDAQALVYTVFGHKQITLTFPTAKATWVCDLATHRWHERESWLGPSADDSIGRWRGSCVLPAFNQILVGDSQSGKVGVIDFKVYTEWGEPIRGLLDGPPIHHDRKRLFMKRFEIDVESGIGLPQAAQETDATYCANAVTITAPTVLTRAATTPTEDPLAGLAANYPTAVFSAWLNLSDAAATGIVFQNAGLSLTVENDATATPQITLVGRDAAGVVVVSATYDFSTWSTWVNLLVSIDTATQRLQVWASTRVAGVLVEAALTPVALAWSSSNPLANPNGGSWTLGVVP